MVTILFPIFRLGIFVTLDSHSAARPKLGLFLGFFAGNIEGTVHRSIDLIYFEKMKKIAISRAPMELKIKVDKGRIHLCCDFIGFPRGSVVSKHLLYYNTSGSQKCFISIKNISISG